MLEALVNGEMAKEPGWQIERSIVQFAHTFRVISVLVTVPHGIR